MCNVPGGRGQPCPQTASRAVALPPPTTSTLACNVCCHGVTGSRGRVLCVVSPTRPLPRVPVSSVRYPVPGIGIRLFKTGPTWPRKVCSTLPSGAGPLLNEFIFYRSWAHVGPHRGPQTQERANHSNARMGQNGGKGLKTGQASPEWLRKVRLTLPLGFEKVGFTVCGPTWTPERTPPVPVRRPGTQAKQRPNASKQLTTAQEGLDWAGNGPKVPI